MLATACSAGLFVECQGPLVGRPRRSMITQCGKQLRAGGMQEVVAAEPFRYLINYSERGFGPAEMAESDGMVEPDHR